ncbi:MAG: hypothetical protein CME66_11975 [Halobacteriovoraceae bacterium]|nr:hypothetical protein [Halobacteriovoraceae bacterium]|tara:strand:- start:346 stop:765 length:420 start_codon:yes stop_codon:yes gene_type:complete
MEVSFGSVYLYSKNPTGLFRFLSFLFDLEKVKKEEDTIDFSLGSTDFRILPSDESSQNLKLSFFNLNVFEPQQLTYLIQNVEFYAYKEGSKSIKVLVEAENYIEFSDSDGRVWRVELLHDSTTFPTKNNDFTTSDVRIC